TTIDEAAIAARLFRKAGDAGPPALESTVASRRPYCRDGGVATMSAMKCDFRADIDIGEAISIGETESLFPLQVIAHPLQAPARQRVFTGVDQCDAPWLRL